LFADGQKPRVPAKHPKRPATSTRKQAKNVGKGPAKKVSAPNPLAVTTPKNDTPRFPPAVPGSLEALAHAAREKLAPNSAGLEHYARAHAGSSAEGMAYLALAAAEVDQGNFAQVSAHTALAQKRLPELADYAAFLAASGSAARKDSAAVEKDLKPVWEAKPRSALTTSAVFLEAKTFTDTGQPDRAIAILDKHRADLPAARLALISGRAYEAAGKVPEAARQYQAVFYDYPMAAEAEEASIAIARLRPRSGYPDAGPAQALTRAEKLLDGGQPAVAQRWLESVLPNLEGVPRERARVLIGQARLNQHQDAAALEYLRGLSLEAPETDAERLYYILRAAERLKNFAATANAIESLARNHPNSQWREKALIAEGNRRVTDNAPSDYLPLFKACYETFPNSEDAAYCHWRIVFSDYLRDRAEAVTGLKAHLRQYPKSIKANAALYFLGRAAEAQGDPPSARAWYDAIVDRYPNSYYAVLARDRLREGALAPTAPSSTAQAFLNQIPRPMWPAEAGFDPSANAVKRLARARLLAASGLEDYAERELRFGAENDGQPQVFAVELATLANRREAPDVAIRYIKHYVPDYLNMPLDAAPGKFWQLAFPLPYRQSLEQYSREHSLDPYLVAALIRQESEFNTRAISVARALGLTQVMPSTGLYLSKKLNIPRFRATLLFLPEVNLKIGTYYLRALLDGLQGSEEAALASYNAGRSHVVNWLAWSKYREPAEFVESIPFSQTRDYVEIVLHNADIYRRLYGTSAVAASVQKTR
jgi:soluble lytic murein transglycosylase